MERHRFSDAAARMQTISPGNTSKLTVLENDQIAKCFADSL
jgi:hypothetical protein